MNRILVVDDDAANRLIYIDELSEEGYDVITGDGGAGLIELIEKKRPDLVVLDLPSDDYDGLCICRDIRKVYDDLPVILSTIYETDRPDVKSGAERYGCKSLDFNELKRTIQQAFEVRGRCPPGMMFNDVQGPVAPLEGRM